MDSGLCLDTPVVLIRNAQMRQQLYISITAKGESVKKIHFEEFWKTFWKSLFCVNICECNRPNHSAFCSPLVARKW